MKLGYSVATFLLSRMIRTATTNLSCQNYQGTISPKHLGDEIAPKLVYLVLENELLNWYTLCWKRSS